MLNRIIGIDPGQKGACATLLIDTGKIVYAEAITMPDISELAEMLEGIDGKVIIEKAQSMPKQGVVSVFNYAKNYGMILGVLEAYRIEYIEVAPQTWKRQMGLEPDINRQERKVKAINMANMLVGHCLRHEIKDDGKAEALLIALWGYYYGN